MSFCFHFLLEKHRGFAFVEFEEVEDAMSAIDNMVSYIFIRSNEI